MFCLLGAFPSSAAAAEDRRFLSPRNLDAPFPYVAGGTRRWPIFRERPPASTEITLSARDGEEKMAAGSALAFSGLSVSIADDGKLEVVSVPGGPDPAFELEVTLDLPGGVREVQTLIVRPAPPDRPLTYISDYGDDLIRMFHGPSPAEFREIDRNAFDSHFRRLQAHGIKRLIMWLIPFPMIADPGNYEPADWAAYEGQTRAFLENKDFDETARGIDRLYHWNWIRWLCSFRLKPEFGPMLSQSAVDHGISLAISFRPFEPAVSTYYEVPVFDHDGTYLWPFLPLASPAVNYHAERVGFAHYRTILSEMGRASDGRLHALKIAGPRNAAVFLQRFRERGDNLRIVASEFPPMHEDSFVLQRQPDGSFKLRRFLEVQERAEAKRHVLTGYELEVQENGDLLISGLRVPEESRYLVLENPSGAEEAIDLPTREPVTLIAESGVRLGRHNLYWSLDGSEEERRLTRLAPVPPREEWRSGREVTRNSWELLRDAPERRPLRSDAVVIERGPAWSPEMVDFNQPEARRYVLKELSTILALPAFDEIFVNTRSHTALAGRIDLAYAPRAAARDPRLIALAVDRPEGDGSLSVRSEQPQDQKENLGATKDSGPVLDQRGVERITVGEPKEWEETCQSPACPSAWRYARNTAVASGMRRLLEDLEAAFPGVRTRVVVPEGEQAVQRIKQRLEGMVRPEGGFYGRQYYHDLWASLNHIPGIGEGMAMVDLSGLQAEPVFLGIRYRPDIEPLRCFLEEVFTDMADNRGSAFRGPRSFFYEGHEMIRPAGQIERRRLEEIICELLSHEDEINEVILYESAAWLYRLPISDPDLCGHGFLDRCDRILQSAGAQE